MRLVQALTSADKVKRREFCEGMQLKMEEDGFVGRLISDKATFHISGKVNIHSVCICAVSHEKVHGSLFFAEDSVTGYSFLDILENWSLPQLNTSYDEYILQLEGATLHFTRIYECL
jgi:hypothetical protein